MKNKRILLAEDEIIIAMDLKNMLSSMGFNNVLTFADGDALLEYALEEPPDLIIADIILKNNTTGIKIAEKLWEKYDVPIIFISAINISTYKKKYDPFKCEFLSKPFKEAELLVAIDKLLNKLNLN